MQPRWHHKARAVGSSTRAAPWQAVGTANGGNVPVRASVQYTEALGLAIFLIHHILW